MSWFDILWAVLSVALAIGAFVISDDEPFVARLCIAALFGLLWLPALILFALMMLTDGIVALLRWVRGA